MTGYSPISRREFVRLSAATAGALTLAGEVASDVEHEKMDREYEFVQSHTPVDYEAPTLVTFSDSSGPDAMASLVEEALTTREPRPAGYARLTATQAEAVAELPTAETLSHSPGSNPFWRLGHYPLGVFPEPRRSTGFVDYEQMIDGLSHLEEVAAERAAEAEANGTDAPPGMNFYSVGQSPGHYNYLSDRVDPKDLYVAEVTKNIDDEDAFAEKTKIMYSLSMHGLERAGAEAGSRFIEKLLTDREAEMEQLLDELVLIFVYPNPDGWVAKHPQYESGWQLVGPEGGAPVAPFYERGNAKVFDTNRQYPTVGWIDPAEYPAEPTGANLEDDEPGWDDDVPDAIREHVPDSLAFVEHFRGYENLEYGADLHGALHLPEFVLGLISQHQFSNREYHQLYAMNRAVDEELESALEAWTTVGDAKMTVTDRNVKALYEVLPEEAFDYGGVWDTIGYTDAGFFGDFMAHPEELGGLGLTSMDFEMAYSHMVGANAYNPELVRWQDVGYETAIRAIARFATRDVDSEVDLGGGSVAFVTTDDLQRSYEDLSFVGSDEELTEVDERHYTGVLAPGGPRPASSSQEHPFDTAELNGDPSRFEASLTWQPDAQDLEFELQDPAGEVVARSTTGSPGETIRGKLEQDGEYTFVVYTWANAIAQYEVDAVFRGTGTTSETNSQLLTLSAGETSTASHDVSADADTLSVSLEHAPGVHGAAELRAPDGSVVRSFDPEETERGAAVGFPRFVVDDPDAGEWTTAVTGAADTEPGDLLVRFGTLASESTNPNPEHAIGYEQRDYGTVDPLQFFDDFDDAVTSGVSGVSVGDAASGALDGDDHVVVIHDDGIDDAAYVGALDDFVADGGNLVLTDTGVHLAAAMSNDLVADVTGDHVVDEELYLGYVGDFPDESVAVTGGEATGKNLDHPLLESTRPIQKQLYKIVPLGYNVGFQAPMTNLDPAAFDAADSESVDATVAGYVQGTGAEGNVGLGSFVPAGSQDETTSGAGVHVVGGLLPPATQDNLHPFGLLDYTVSFFGEQVLTNALGGRQVRYVDGEVVETFGSVDEGDSGGDGGGSQLSASGSRSDDGSVFTGGQTNQVDVRVESVSATATVTDEVPTEWTVLRGGTRRPDSRVVELGTVSPEETPTTFTYFAESPADSPGEYTFGPAAAEADGETAEVAGTDANYVAPSQNQSSGL